MQVRSAVPSKTAGMAVGEKAIRLMVGTDIL